MQQQESYWKQKAKQFWLAADDSNTKYFHQFASSKRKKNAIMKLKDDHDRWLSWDSGLQHLIVNCFKDLFSFRGCNGEEIFSTAKRKVSDMQNYELLRPFEGYEIKDEIFSMHHDKSLGPDGMNLGFYQHF